MKLTTTNYKLLSIAILITSGLLHTASAEEYRIINADVCNNNRGWSIPGTGPYCTKGDCCNWYQTAHVHDVGFNTPGGKDKTLIYTYTPGFNNGCTDTLTLSTSSDGSTFTTAKTLNVVSRRLGGGWQSYTDAVRLNVPFRYVKIQIPSCYNDYSKVDAVWWQW